MLFGFFSPANASTRIRVIRGFCMAFFTVAGISVSANPSRGFFTGGNLFLETNRSFPRSLSSREELALPGAEILFGYRHNDLFSLDVRLGFGTGERSLTEENEDAFARTLSRYGSIYWRPEVVNPVAKVYMLLGYTYLEAEENSLVNKILSKGEFSASNPTYGFGLAWFVNANTTFNVEYKVLVNDSSAEFSTLSVGLNYRIKAFLP